MLRMTVLPVDTPSALRRQNEGSEGRLSPCKACKVRDLTVCSPLSDDELAEISAIRTTVELGPGEPLFDESTPADHVFNVTDGAMKVYKLLPDGRRQITGFLFAGDFLGFANDDAYAYSAEAVTHVGLCRFQRRKLEALLRQHPKLEQRLLTVASHELVAAQEQMLLLGRKSAREKLASFLINLSDRAVRRGLPDNPIDLPMTRNDIGDYLGLSTETVSRTFTLFKREGTISDLPNHKVQVSDKDLLLQVSEGY